MYKPFLPTVGKNPPVLHTKTCCWRKTLRSEFGLNVVLKKTGLILRIIKITGLSIIALSLWYDNGILENKLSIYEKAEIIKMTESDGSGISIGGGPLLICVNANNCINLITELKNDFAEINSFHILILVFTAYMTAVEIPEVIREIKESRKKE